MDDERLKQGGNRYFRELLQRIRDIIYNRVDNEKPFVGMNLCNKQRCDDSQELFV